MYNLLSYCGLVDTSISASDKDLPVTWVDKGQQFSECIVFAFEFLFKGTTRLFENKIYLQKGTLM